jgi:YVTN family beta-propeller protein
MKWSLAGSAVLIVAVGAVGVIAQQKWGASSLDRVSTGKAIRPVGSSVAVGSYPVNSVLSPDGQFAVVTDIGFRQQLSVIRLSDGKLVDRVEFNENKAATNRGLYYGLAFNPSYHKLYVSEGAEDAISIFDLSDEGKLTQQERRIKLTAPKERKFPYHFAGLAFGPSGQEIYAVENQTSFGTDYKGGLAVIKASTGELLRSIPVGGYPLDIAVKPGRVNKVYVGCERDAKVDIVDPDRGTIRGSIKTGAQPVDLIMNSDGSRLFVANSGSDTVSIIDTVSDKVIRSILLRPSDLRGLPGVAPVGLALSADEKTLYVACADMNAVAVVSLVSNQMTGYIPTGWLPTSIQLSKDQTHFLVTSAKGIQPKNPNAKDVGSWGKYIQNIIEGTATLVKIPSRAELSSTTNTVLQANFIRKGLHQNSVAGFTDPGIEHVIYIIKENRTYDNVLGDLPQGNGDPSICLFPRKVTPNMHALAERFVLLDNFHVCAEVSQDGWVWSTAGMMSQYASRNTPYNYSGRGRTYDTEGSNSNVPVDLFDIPDVARPASGYIWDQCVKHGVSFRNYGFFVQDRDPEDKRFGVADENQDNKPAKKALIGMTDVHFRRYDTSYADSDLWLHYNNPWPKQMRTFGDFKSTSRYREWKREFDDFIAKGKVPSFMMIRFPQDHTTGTQVGQPTPEAMLADNDYAVGKLVEAVSHSPIWEKTAICILEDDAQAGYDHVDAHRSTAFVISPYIAPGTVDSTFYNTDSMLRTMELLLGMPPMSQFDAVASPINVFSGKLANLKPYVAIIPDKDIAMGINQKNAYRSGDSDKISRYTEESLVDEDLNDILWGAVKGTSARPAVKRGWQVVRGGEDDDD